jgi:HEAT repeat protein
MYRRGIPVLGLGLTLLLAAAPARAQEATTYLGKERDYWGKELSSDSPMKRRAGAFALGKIGIKGGVYLKQLIKLLDADVDASVREASARAIGEICKPFGPKNKRQMLRITDYPALIPILKTKVTDDPDPLVKRSAAVALGCIGKRAHSAQAALNKAVADASPAVRQNAAWALGQIEPTDLSGLKRALSDDDATVIRDAAKAVAEVADTSDDAAKLAHQLLPELLNRSVNQDTEVRKAVVGALAKIVTEKDDAAVNPLRERLKESENIEVRYNAALALGNMGGARAAPAVPLLVQALKQVVDPELRGQAAVVLRNIGPDARDALEPLRKALADLDPGLRANAAFALGGLGQAAAPAYDDLMKHLTDRSENATTRYQAASALKEIGEALRKAKAELPPADKSVPPLVGVLQDNKADPKVRERVLWAVAPYAKDLPRFKDFFVALEGILPERKTKENKMLRYEAAYFLAMLQPKQVKPKTLDVLLEFLNDDDVQLYAGAAGTGGGTGEGGTGASSAKEKGQGDGRVMVVQALKRVGAQQVMARQDIWKQLQNLERNNATDPALRTKIRELLESAAPAE